MMNSEANLWQRRGILQRGAALAALALGVKSNRSLAQAPSSVGTAITLVQMGMGAAKMFQRSSVSNTDEVIIRMLDNVSRQLAVIQSGITLIAEQIEQVRNLVVAVPSEVVQEHFSAQLRGYVHGYGELLRIRAAYGDDRKTFMREREKTVQTLISNIQGSRNVLINYPNQLHIPVLAAALHIEYGCMRLIDESDNAIVPMIGTYRAYLTNALLNAKDGLAQRIASIRATRRQMLMTGEDPQFLVGRVFPFSGSPYWYVNIGYAKFDASTTALPDAMAAELMALGLISDDERHVTVTDRQDMRHPHRNTASICKPLTGAGEPTGCQGISSFPTQANLTKSRNDARKKFEQEVNGLTDKLYVAVSNYYAGMRALNFTQQFAEG